MLTSNLVVYTKINLNVDIKTSVVLADSLLNDIYLTLPTKQLNDQGRYDYIEVDIKKLREEGYRNINVMIPLVTNVDEIRKVKENKVKKIKWLL